MNHYRPPVYIEPDREVFIRIKGRGCACKQGTVSKQRAGTECSMDPMGQFKACELGLNVDGGYHCQAWTGGSRILEASW